MSERLITGDAGDREKFIAFCSVLPQAIGNPVYHWSHLELRRIFDIDTVINEKNAPDLWDEVNRRLATIDAWSFLDQAKVEILCTTDDPADDLKAHAELAQSGLRTRVLPSFRPDRAMAINDPRFAAYLATLGGVTGTQITSFANLIAALECRVALLRFARRTGKRPRDRHATSGADRQSEGNRNYVFAAARGCRAR